MPVGKLDEIVGRTRVARIGDRCAACRDPNAGIRDRVREQSRLDRERADRERVAGLEFADLTGVLQGRDLIERQHRAQGIRKGVGRQRGASSSLHQASAEQRVQIGDVVRMAVADEDGVDRLGRQDLEEPRDDRVSRIDKQAEPVVLDEVATAGTASRREPAGAAQDGESHRSRVPLERLHAGVDSVGQVGPTSLATPISPWSFLYGPPLLAVRSSRGTCAPQPRDPIRLRPRRVPSGPSSRDRLHADAGSHRIDHATAPVRHHAGSALQTTTPRPRGSRRVRISHVWANQRRSEARSVQLDGWHVTVDGTRDPPVSQRPEGDG